MHVNVCHENEGSRARNIYVFKGSNQIKAFLSFKQIKAKEMATAEMADGAKSIQGNSDKLYDHICGPCKSEGNKKTSQKVLRGMFGIFM